MGCYLFIYFYPESHPPGFWHSETLAGAATRTFHGILALSLRKLQFVPGGDAALARMTWREMQCDSSNSNGWG